MAFLTILAPQALAEKVVACSFPPCYTDFELKCSRAVQVRVEWRSAPLTRSRGGNMAQIIVRETILQELEGLAEDLWSVA